GRRRGHGATNSKRGPRVGQGERHRAHRFHLRGAPVIQSPVMRTLALCMILMCSLLAVAAAPAHARPVVLKAARLFDGRGDQLSRPGVVVIDGDRIVAVGSGAAVPADAEVIDLGDATLMPGLMDAHTHLTMEFSANWDHDELDWFKKPVPQVAIESTAR